MSPPLVRSFAGIWDTRRIDDSDMAALQRTLAADGPVETVREGPVALAYTSGQPHVDAGVVTYVDGDLFNLDDLGAVGGSPEARLAALHRRDGDALFPKLRGDFVIVIADTVAGVCTVLRDQLGSRSMVWLDTGGRVSFAAEVQHLLTLLGRRPAPDPVAVAHWISVSGLPPGHTFYEGIHRLDPGHLLRFGTGRSSTRRYWTPVYREPVPVDGQAAVAGLKAVATQAVRRRSGPDTGVLLSGGLDSSTVAGLASTLPRELRPRRAYSAVFPEHASVDESGRIAQLTAAFKLDSTTVVVRGGSALSGAAAYIDRWSIPPASPNLFFWLPLLRHARADGILRMLDGEGGDEVLSFSPALIADRVRRLQLRAAADLVRRIPGGSPNLTRKQVMPYFKSFGVKGAVPASVHQAVRRLRGGNRYTPSWVARPSQRTFMASDQTVAWKRIRGPRWWAFMVDVMSRNMGPAYGYDHVRRRNQLCGLEPSHPLSDVDVIEYMLSLPPDIHYDTRYSRPLVRDAMAGITPDDVRLRASKSFFNAVFEGAMAGVDADPLRRLLRPDAHIGALIEFEAVRALLDDPPPDGQRAFWALGLWRLATLELWFRAQAGELEDTLSDLQLAPADVAIVPAN